MDTQPPTALPSKRKYQMAADALAAAVKCREQDSPLEAIANCSKAIRLDPEQIGAYLLRASCHLRTGDLDRAIADCTTVILNRPDNKAAYGVRASAYLGKGDSEKATVDFRRWRDSSTGKG